jgi:flagellar protein FlaI
MALAGVGIGRRCIMVSPPRILSGDSAPDKGDIGFLPRDPGPARALNTREMAFETRPAFASSWIMPERYTERDVVARYVVDNVPVTILSSGESSCGVYLVEPPEYHMNPRQIRIMADVMEELRRSGPGGEDVPSLSMMRAQIRHRAKDMTYASLARVGKELSSDDLERQADRLADVVCKYTAGFGVLETMLRDPLVQDVYVDAPSAHVPVQVVLRSDTEAGVRQKCRTNVFVGARDLQAFVSRVKYETGLAFSEAVPVLEADLRDLSSRVTLVSPPLSDRGVSVAIRRHSRETWAMPRLIANGSLSPLISAFLWACALGRRAVLIAGSRGAGKTTLLTATMLEFPLSQRILLIEDTPEIPVRRFQELGYDIQTLRYSSGGKRAAATEAKDALRVSLRMGESAIVIGEVRGEETRVLSESMRAGSAGSSVLGTIHGNSATGVLDRAVEDLGISERAFSSTDIVVVIGLIRSPDGARFVRRVVEVAEVRPSGSSASLVPLFRVERGSSCAKPTDEFSTSARSVVGIARSLGVSPERAMDLVRVKAHADQISSSIVETPRPGHGCRTRDDASRVRSNEVFADCVFSSPSQEAGLKEWIRRNDLEA